MMKKDHKIYVHDRPSSETVIWPRWPRNTRGAVEQWARNALKATIDKQGKPGSAALDGKGEQESSYEF